MIITREWSMPDSDTFSVPVIGAFVKRYLLNSKVSVDPFARNKRWATWNNDLNPQTAATHHMEAGDFLKMLKDQGVVADIALFDPVYSPRQLAECYSQIGRKTNFTDTQASTWTAWRDALIPILSPDSIVLSFGWNSNGMGKCRGFEAIELLIVDHGGMHNSTLCLAEKRLPGDAMLSGFGI